MTISAVPFALQNVPINADIVREAVSSLVPNGGGLVQLGDLPVAQLTTPAMGVQVGVGRAWIDGTNLSHLTGQGYGHQGQYFIMNDAATTVTIAPSDATNPRIDVIYAVTPDTAYTGTNNTPAITVAQGQPTPGAAYPANAPTLPANSIALAWVYVGATVTTIINSNITMLAAPYSYRYVEYTGSTNPTPGASWGPGALTLDAANSVNYSSWVSTPSNDRITLAPGVYQIFIRYTMSANASGTTFGAITNDGNTVTYTSADIAAGYSTCAAQTPLLIQTSQNVRFTFSTGATVTLTSRVRVVKLI